MSDEKTDAALLQLREHTELARAGDLRPSWAEQATMRTCNRCRARKPSTNFYRKARRDGPGRRPTCRECELETRRAKYRNAARAGGLAKKEPP